MDLLGPFPRLQAVVDISTEYCMKFYGVLWEKWPDKYILEKDLERDVWREIGEWKLGQRQ